MSKEFDVLYKLADISAHAHDPDTAKLTISLNKVVDRRAVPGLFVEAREQKKGVSLKIRIAKGAKIRKPVHLCFGVLEKTAVQHIELDVTVEDRATASIFGHCVFPSAKDVRHIMDARIRIGRGAVYSYFERHLHDDLGGVNIAANAAIAVGMDSKFKTEFELIRGRVGKVHFNYKTSGEASSSVEMEARMSGYGRDRIVIDEHALLEGRGAKAVLKSRVAVRDTARAEVHNTIIARGPYSQGHVDCTEILLDRGIVRAYPAVEVLDPTARVTHEAKLGGVDNRQLETLMARGLTAKDAEAAIIEGLLS